MDVRVAGFVVTKRPAAVGEGVDVEALAYAPFPWTWYYVGRAQLPCRGRLANVKALW